VVSVFIGCLVEQTVSFELLNKPAKPEKIQLVLAGSIYIIVLIMGGKHGRGETLTVGWRAAIYEQE
jgi:hypothetical protein